MLAETDFAIRTKHSIPRRGTSFDDPTCGTMPSIAACAAFRWSEEAFPLPPTVAGKILRREGVEHAEDCL